MKSIVLASQSPRRKQLLSLLYDQFICHPSHIDENIPYQGNPEVYCTELAALKVAEVAQLYPDSLVIGSDTIVIFNGTSLGKPETKEHAVELLSQLSGNTHDVHTGVSLQFGLKKMAFSVCTHVTFHEMSREEIVAYVETGSPMDKAGAYGIQDDWGAVFVKHINGDYYNVVGFPLQAFYRNVREHYPEFLPVPHQKRT